MRLVLREREREAGRAFGNENPIEPGHKPRGAQQAHLDFCLLRQLKGRTKGHVAIGLAGLGIRVPERGHAGCIAFSCRKILLPTQKLNFLIGHRDAGDGTTLEGQKVALDPIREDHAAGGHLGDQLQHLARY